MTVKPTSQNHKPDSYLAVRNDVGVRQIAQVFMVEKELVVELQKIIKDISGKNLSYQEVKKIATGLANYYLALFEVYMNIKHREKN